MVHLVSEGRQTQAVREGGLGAVFLQNGGNEFIPSASNCQEMALEKALILQSRAETFPSGGFYSPSISVGMGCDSFTCPILVKMTLVKMTGLEPIRILQACSHPIVPRNTVTAW